MKATSDLYQHVDHFKSQLLDIVSMETATPLKDLGLCHSFINDSIPLQKIMITHSENPDILEKALETLSSRKSKSDRGLTRQAFRELIDDLRYIITMSEMDAGE